jgi:hypothetical protein
MNRNNLSDQQIVAEIILPKVKETFPLAKIIGIKKVKDSFRIGLLKILNNPNSGIIQSWMIINHEPVLISEN